MNRRRKPVGTRCRARFLSGSVLLLLLLGVSGRFSPATPAQEIGTDIAGLNLCLYGDCEARGAYAADPFGLTNPGTMPVGILAYLPRGVFFSGSYFRLNVGGIATDISSPSITVALDPWILEVNVVYAEGGGSARTMPGTHLSLRSRLVRLAAGVDLGRTSLGLKGLSVGLIAGVPGTDSNLRVSAGGMTLADSHENHEIGLTPGVHYRTGYRDWFNVGAFVDAERHHSSDRMLDPNTFESIQQHGTTNAWFARGGLSILPFVPLGLTEDPSPAGEMLRDVRLAADLEHRNISALGESTRKHETGYFGLDTRLLPDAWNPLSDYLSVYLIGGADTDEGWGIGSGLYGNGALQFLTCNPAYSSRPMAKSLGDRVNIWAATCSVLLPL